MISAIIKKDIALLRLYILASITVSLACYLLAIALTVWFTSHQEKAVQTLVQRSFLSLCIGGPLGFFTTILLGALLAGSAVTLERSDRSVEFLACLPPTRWQNLSSKILVVCSVVVLMAVLHLATTLTSFLLIPYVRVDLRIQALNPTTVATFLCLIVSTVGGAWGFASCMKSNGAPIVLGMATPFLTLTLVLLVGKLLDIPSEGDSFQLRYNTGSIILGSTLGLIGSYLYLTRREP